jgi:ssDNA-binding Zn-finger/Zn-ribbon topoisomerase 1
MKTLLEAIKEITEPPFCISMGYSGGKGISISVICNMFYRHLGDKLLGWITAALDEKREREFGEPLRWGLIQDKKFGASYVCPKCGRMERYLSNKNYCPFCGQKLLPPIEGNKGR